MDEKSKVIYQNRISDKDYRKAQHSKQKFIRKYGDDARADYPAKLVENRTLFSPLGVYDIRVAEGEGELVLEDPAYCASVAFTVGSWIEMLDKFAG